MYSPDMFESCSEDCSNCGGSNTIREDIHQGYSVCTQCGMTQNRIIVDNINTVYGYKDCFDMHHAHYNEQDKLHALTIGTSINFSSAYHTSFPSTTTKSFHSAMNVPSQQQQPSPQPPQPPPPQKSHSSLLAATTSSAVTVKTLQKASRLVTDQASQALEKKLRKGRAFLQTSQRSSLVPAYVLEEAIKLWDKYVVFKRDTKGHAKFAEQYAAAILHHVLLKNNNLITISRLKSILPHDIEDMNDKRLKVVKKKLESFGVISLLPQERSHFSMKASDRNSLNFSLIKSLVKSHVASLSENNADCISKSADYVNKLHRIHQNSVYRFKHNEKTIAAAVSYSVLHSMKNVDQETVKRFTGVCVASLSSCHAYLKKMINCFNRTNQNK